jgi:protein involved in polysaccharide export with SLBB domain
MSQLPRILLFAMAGLFLGSGPVVRAQSSAFPAPPPLPPLKAADNQADPGAATNSNPLPPEPMAPAPAAPAVPALAPEPDAAPVAATPAPTAAATLSSMDALDDRVKLEAGDRVSFRVVEDRDDAVARIVTDTGEIDFPYIGRVQVEGRTCRDVALQVKKLLEVNYYYRATVILGLDVINSRAAPARETVWIVGEVRQVGPQELAPTQSLTVSQVILRAGGFADFADQRKVRLVHRAAGGAAPTAAEKNIPADSQVVDVKAIFRGESSADPVVKANDLIIVPKRLVNF